MNILLTGATGFLGSHLARALLNDGDHIIALKRSGSNLKRLTDIETAIQFYDLENLDITRPFKENRPIGAVIHTATCYGRAGESPLEILQANIQLPLRLLTTALESNVAAFFNTDTILPAHLNTYALSKKHFADWGRILCDGSETSFLNIRLEHMYGPGDDSTKFTTWIVEQCLQGVPEIALTPGGQKRDFIYVKDVVDAYRILLARSDSFDRGSTSIDLGSGKPVSLRQFIQIVHRLTESTSQLNYGALPYRQNEEMNSCADIGTLRSLGWEQKYTLENGLQEVIKAARAQLLSRKR